jgi:hypothetical protein
MEMGAEFPPPSIFHLPSSILAFQLTRSATWYLNIRCFIQRTASKS